MSAARHSRPSTLPQVTTGQTIWRLAALLLVAASALHTLRDRLAPGSLGPLHEHGHGSAALLGPLTGLAVAALLAAGLLRAAAQAPRAQRPRPPLRVVWPLATAALLLTLASQETVEGLLAHGRHPSGPQVLLGGSGAPIVLVSAALGGLVAVALRLSVVVDERTPVPASMTCLLRDLRLADISCTASAGTLLLRTATIARNLGGRAPPRTS